ncbi:MAG TPA: IS30 family transposase [Acidimicrobiia bacterium]|nr:IS30 family transposase [Acidimicrobiia bacterium]
MRRFNESELALIWDRRSEGVGMRTVARELGRAHGSVRWMVESYGGVRPRPRIRSPRHLSLEEREEISRGMASGESLRSIARRLGRSASTVSREVARNGGRSGYRAHRAAQAALRRARRPKVCRLAANPALALMVEEKLGLWWSPQQISGWLKETYPESPEMWVSHETIYLTLFVQGRGALKHELTTCLRTRRAIRRPTKKLAPTGKGQIRNPVMISERPAEADDRAVPGHWEGDLLMGKRQTAIGTLVERWSRYVMLFRLPDGNSAESVRTGLAEVIQRLPEHLWQSLTWDQGKEMAEHAQFTIDTGIQIYFCDPKSPWQRGSNENTNGLLRQYFPKTTDMATLTQAELDEAAYSLNSRPRQTLRWMTPSQKLAEALR